MKELFRNCLSVEENDGWYKPIRFTEKQLDKYAEVDGWKTRSLCASSVCLSFYTEEKSIALEYRIGRMARDWACFDLTVDGALAETVEVTDKQGIVTFELPADKSREISIYLPHIAEVDVRIENASSYCPVRKKEKLWLALGDSITQGMVTRRPTSAYPTVVSEQLGYEVINAGVGGIAFNAEELDYIGREPDLITVALGCNDWFSEKDIEGFKVVVREYFDRLLSLYSCRDIRVILPIWISIALEEVNGKTFAQNRAAIKEVALEYGFIRIIDGYELLPHDTYFYNDPKGERQVHPSDEGMMVYGLGLMKRLSGR